MAPFTRKGIPMQMGTAPPPPTGEQAPAVLIWFRVYCGLMALLYLLVVGLGVLFLVLPAANEPDFTPQEQLISGIACVVVGLPLMAAFLAAFFLPPRKWVWVYDLLLICVGLTSCCFWPICIPLLIFWINSGTRRWFGWV